MNEEGTSSVRAGMAILLTKRSSFKVMNSVAQSYAYSSWQARSDINGRPPSITRR